MSVRAAPEDPVRRPLEGLLDCGPQATQQALRAGTRKALAIQTCSRMRTGMLSHRSLLEVAHLSSGRPRGGSSRGRGAGPSSAVRAAQTYSLCIFTLT
jgi:hypothetical protein